MTSKAITLLATTFGQIFRIFTSVKVPCTNMTFAQLLFFCAVFPLALKFLATLFGMPSATQFTSDGNSIYNHLGKYSDKK